MNRADRRRRGERGPNPARVPPPPIAGRDYSPAVSTPRQWRRALLMLFVGLLLTALWIGLFDWSKQRSSAPNTPAPTVHSVETPLAVEMWHRAREQNRIAAAFNYQQEKAAAPVLALVHYLPFPLFLLLGAACYRGMQRRLGDAGSVACLRVATMAMVLCALGCTMFAWRIAYVPLADWIWEACGGQMMEYERTHSKNQGNRRTGGGLDFAYQIGQMGAFAVWVGGAYLYTHRNASRER